MELETVKTIANILTPFVLSLFGFLIVKRIEKIKIEVNKNKEWETKWSDNFFNTISTANEMSVNIMGIMTQLHVMTLNEMQTNEQGIKLQEELEKLIFKTYEHDFAIGTQAHFAEQYGAEVIRKAQNMFVLLRSVITTKSGNVKDIEDAVCEFNLVAKKAHRELLVKSN